MRSSVAKRTYVTALLILSVLGTGLLLTKLPLCDEGFYGIPAYYLAQDGMLKNPLMESAGVPMFTGIHTILYWMVPGAMLLQAVAFKVFGFHLLVQRAVSLSAALGTLSLWWIILRRLFDDRVAALTCLLLSLDYVFLSLATVGRADMLSLFFSSAALASYLNFREKSLGQALVLANACCAISGLIHPNGGISGLLSLSAVVLYFDRRQIHIKHLFAAAMPYLVFALIWALWIQRDPSYFRAQFLGNITSRTPHSVRSAVSGEASRYLIAFGAHGGNVVRNARAIIPLAYLLAIAGCALLLRRMPHVGLLLLLAALQAFALFVSEGSKQGYYLIHSMPVLDTSLALWLIYLWHRRRFRTTALLMGHALVIAIVAVGMLNLVARRDYQRAYQPAIAFLNAHVRPGQLVFGRSEMVFGMNCKSCLMDDLSLGAASGRIADWIVIDPDYAETFQRERVAGRPRFRVAPDRLEFYRERFNNGSFYIHSRD